MKTYSGTYKVQNQKKYKGNYEDVIYRSRWELYCFKWCDENPDIKKWSSEEVIVPYYYEVTKRYHRYFLDLFIEFTNGKKLLVEVKPKKHLSPPTGKRRTKRYLEEAMTYVKNQNKWEAAKKYAEDNSWEFVIWTEKELTDMKIMPKWQGTPKKKVPGKLPPLKKYKRTKKRPPRKNK